MGSPSPLQQLKGVRDTVLLHAGETPFTWLCAYYAGYESGYAAAQHGHMAAAEFVPPHFHQFVAEHYGVRWPTPKGWSLLIQEHTSSERYAFEMFFHLREEYEKR